MDKNDLVILTCGLTVAISGTFICFMSMMMIATADFETWQQATPRLFLMGMGAYFVVIGEVVTITVLLTSPILKSFRMMLWGLTSTITGQPIEKISQMIIKVATWDHQLAVRLNIEWLKKLSAKRHFIVTHVCYEPLNN